MTAMAHGFNPVDFGDWRSSDDRVVSEAGRLGGILEKQTRECDRSILVGETRRTALDALETEASKASIHNWDGYGAPPVNATAMTYARHFLALLPLNACSPEITIDNDGEVNFQWDFGRRCVFSVSIGRDGTLTYAGLFGYNKMHGTEMLAGTIPMVVSGGIARAIKRSSI